MNHGHVTPRPDGTRARCGGPRMCRECQREAAALAPIGRVVELRPSSPPRAYEDPRWAERHAPEPAPASVPNCGNVFADLGLPDAEALLAAADACIAAGDCGCTAGHVCRRNNACPRLTG